KKEEEFSRPDKGERVRITIALSVEEVHLDRSIERIRVKGTIVEASEDSVTKAGSHAVTLSPGHPLTIRKEKWSPLDTRLVRPPQGFTKRFVVVAADRREAGVGTLSGSHLKVLTSIESGLGGKMSGEQSSAPYVSKVADLLAQTCVEGDEVVIAGPGNFKSSIANQARERLKSNSVNTIEGIDLTGSDGVRAIVKAPSFQELAKGSLLVEMQKLVGEIVRRIGSGDPKVAYSMPRVSEASAAGAVEACIVSDDVFSSGIDEEDLVKVLNTVEAKGGSVFLADSSMEFGKQVSSFGGIVALLRYPIRAY
ncbi:MAG: pelota family protein, partial [Thaumarchaeota archaeon]|nr:pelota family protein [Nitrososphaerota archaeon]